MPFLIFRTYEDAVARNDAAGNDARLAFHKNEGVTRYVWGVDVEDSNNPRAALVIDRRNNLLTSDETAELVESLPNNWQFPSDP